MITSIKGFLRFRALKALFAKHERRLVPAMLLIGFLVDVVTFRTIQTSTAFAILGVYTVLAGVMIAYMHRFDAHRKLIEQPTMGGYVRLAAPLVVQFTFGALLSAALIFFWFSGSFGVSWPFLLVVIGLMAANDVLREHYLRPTVQLSVYYFTLFTTLAVVVPTLTGSISPWMFAAAATLSLLLMGGYLFWLFRLRPDLRFMRPSPLLAVGIIFVLMSAAYVLNIIPPIPLSLTEIGVYDRVERVGDEYVLTGDEQSFLDRFVFGERIYVLGGRVYVYASIFAPVDLDTTVIHHWQRYEKGQGWVSVSRLSYPIRGGRADGYRGYSYISSHTPGRWRVDVETERGQVIGRLKFHMIEREHSNPPLL